ncbi:ATP-dependent DNA helicase PIF1 (DNA repair and recombination helicase PIF1), partial [Durusdinium trenchii]
MEYIIRKVIDGPAPKSLQPDRLRLLMHGAGGCGKAFILRAAAHSLRESGHGVVIAVFTGAAVFNINGVTLHQCCALPVLNNNYGFSADAPPPSGARLANLKRLWSKARALFIDEISFVSSEMWECVDKNLRLACEMPTVPFGDAVTAGDQIQLPPPRGLPIFANVSLWPLFELIELQGNHRAARDPHWAALLGRVRIGQWTEVDIADLQGRLVRRGQAASGARHLHVSKAADGEMLIRVQK